MDFDLYSCTFENLNSLKFNELQKLSSQFHVNKRWAKKREIIDRLLLLKEEEIAKKKSLPDEAQHTSPEHTDWIDGNKAFSTIKLDNCSDTDDNRRLTYNISNSVDSYIDRRLTFNVVKETEVKSIINENPNSMDIIDRRLTYNADNLRIQEMHRTELHATSQGKEGTDLQNGEDKTADAYINQNADIKDPSIFAKSKECSSSEDESLKYEKKNQSLNVNSETKCTLMQTNSKFNTNTKIKMLTIPTARAESLSRRSMVKRVPESITLNLKISEKSINIKKPMKTPTSAKSPFKSHTAYRNHLSNQKSIASTNLPLREKKIGHRVMGNEQVSMSKSTQKEIKSDKPHTRTRQKSKTEDNVLVQNIKSSRNLHFFTPRTSNISQKGTVTESAKESDFEINMRNKLQTKSTTTPTMKPITHTKMPDFSKIHQKQFEQMDSLHDYQKKKEERVKKLFGISRSAIPIKVNKNNANTVFQFKSTCEKENHIGKSTEINKISTKKLVSTKSIPLTRSGFKSSVTDLKEQNRKHLHGVRTNKRFELQMKFRQL